jgi:hypothetical protein
MKKIFFFLILLGIAFWMGHAFAGQPGSISDPLVTKSFLEKTYGWQFTVLQPGDKLPLDLGSEVVLRSGQVEVLGTEAGGLADLTEGEDLGNGVLIPVNHYILCPASDGRGIKAMTTAVLLTRGLVR